MCTVTVRQTPGSLLVTMNRDEARTRAPEHPPAVGFSETGLPWIAPRDGELGGTWMGVNAHGVVACLMNRYQDQKVAPSGANPPTRGLIVPAVLSAGDAEAALTFIESSFYPDDFMPFTLLLIAHETAHEFAWHGAGRLEPTAHAGEWTMLSSSFFDTSRVLQWRAELFQEWLHDGAPFEGDLPAFHVLQPVDRAYDAPLMDRDVSCTRSITQAVLEAGRPIRMRYGPVVDGRVELETYPLDPLQGTP